MNKDNKKTLRSKFQRLLTQYKSNEAGNFSVTTAVCMFALLAGVGLAVDASNAQSAKTRLQDTTDAIALLAVKENLQSQTELNQAANNYLRDSMVNTRFGNAFIDEISRKGDVVTVKASNNINTYFANIMGHDVFKVSVESQAIQQNRGLDLALVLDSTGSMGGNKITTLKQSATALLDTLENTDNPNIRTSVIPFAEYVNIGRSNQNQPWLDEQAITGQWEGCVGSRGASLRNKLGVRNAAIPAVDDVQCTSELQPLTHNLNRAKATISNMAAAGWTYMPAGLMWGLRTLEPEAPFTEASRTRGNVSDIDRVLVLMSDGDNTVRVANAGPFHRGGDNGNQADALTADICETVKDRDIIVYTIAYEIQGADTRNLLENCATAPNNYFDARNSADLERAFEAIGEALTRLRLNA